MRKSEKSSIKRTDNRKYVELTGMIQLHVDLGAEVERLSASGLTAKQLSRQLAIIEAFGDKNDFSKCRKLYDQLPYDERNECSEKDYVGVWFEVISDAIDRFHIHLSDKFSDVRFLACRHEIRISKA